MPANARPRDPGSAGPSFFASLPMEVNFHLIRHGESEGNALGRVQGLLDAPLTATGRAQAAALGAWLGDKGLRAVLSSPLSRALETARIAAALAGGPAVAANGLFVEMDAGAFSGLTLAEAEERYPEAYDRFNRESWEAVPGAERADSLYARAMGCWEALRSAAAASGGDVAAVTHGGLIQWLLKATFGLRSWMPIVTAGTCGVFLLEVRPGGKGGQAYMNWRLVNFEPGPAAPGSVPRKALAGSRPPRNTPL